MNLFTVLKYRITNLLIKSIDEKVIGNASVFKKIKLSKNCFTIAMKRGEIKQNDWTSISEVKSLGIQLDSQLTMYKHIMYVKQYCIRQLKSWKHIANF